MYCSAFPMLTPFFYSHCLNAMAIKNNSVVIGMRMQPNKKNKPKKRKRK